MSDTTGGSIGRTAVRPFTIEIPDVDLEALRARVAATRWPSQELVSDRSQGVQLATIQELARYWTSDYDWRRCQARLNALPQFQTDIDGVDVHRRSGRCAKRQAASRFPGDYYGHVHGNAGAMPGLGPVGSW